MSGPTGKRKRKAERLDIFSSDDGEFGEVCYTDSFGEWRTVPGLNRYKIIVSSKGWVRCCIRNRITDPYIPLQLHSGYCTVAVEGNQYLVHALVCRAFNGPAPQGKHTVDHIAKYDGDFMKERSDNRAVNLRWASMKDQNVNRVTSADSREHMRKPCSVRHKDWDAHTPSLMFVSLKAASDWLGCTGLDRTMSTNPSRKRAHRRGFIATYLDAQESQEDLPATLQYSAEVWVQVSKDLRVSSRGRVQPLNHHKYTPVATSGQPYAKYGAQAYHRLVFFAFGGTLQGNETVDHINGDASDNCFENLRAATKREQVINRNMKPREDRNDILKVSVWGKPRGSNDDAWEMFESQKRAQEDLRERTGLNFHNSGISMATLGKTTHHQGWVFSRSPPRA